MKHVDPRPVMDPETGRKLARTYAAQHPEDTEFASYLARAEASEWQMRLQAVRTSPYDPTGTLPATWEDRPVWTRVVEWFYVPPGYAVPKAAQRVTSGGRGHSSCGSDSRGDWYLRTEHTWTDPHAVVAPAIGEQIAMFA